MRVYAFIVLASLCVAYPPATGVWAVAALLYATSQIYARRLKAQMARESDPFVLRPFIQRSDVPRQSWIAPYPVILMAGAVIVGMTTLAFSGLTHIIFWASGGSSYLPLEDAPLWICMMVLGGWYGLLVLVVETINKQVMEGRIFKSYEELVTYVRRCRTSEDVLAYAPVLRHAAKMHIRAPYDLFRIWSSWRAAEDHSAYYRFERLLETLIILEQRIPHESSDERLRQRYWSYGRSIYRVLHTRNQKLVEGSLFAQPYSSLVSTASQKQPAAQMEIKPNALNGQFEPQSVLN